MTLHIMPNHELMKLGWRTKMMETEEERKSGLHEPYFMYSLPDTDWVMEKEAWEISRARVTKPAKVARDTFTNTDMSCPPNC